MNRRIAYIDALRGFAILSVVYSHLIVMGMRGNAYHSPVLSVINLYFMPLFFFLSGYLSGRLCERVSDIHSLATESWKKFKTLLIPTVAMFLLNRAYFGQSVWRGIDDSYKGGYWFTFVLFAIIILYLILNLLLRPLHKWGG